MSLSLSSPGQEIRITFALRMPWSVPFGSPVGRAAWHRLPSRAPCSVSPVRLARDRCAGASHCTALLPPLMARRLRTLPLVLLPSSALQLAVPSCSGPMSNRMVRPGLAYPGLVWRHLDWLGLVWFGPVHCRVFRTPCAPQLRTISDLWL